jgi:tRNA(fMet)-specific endonuclease VapC
MTKMSAFTLLAAALALGPAAPALSQSLPRGGMLLHGNYCGPGNRAPLPPIDALDAACARHDACTPRGGLASAACNARLQREAEAVANDPRQPSDLRGTAGIVALGATLLPSAPTYAAAPTQAYRPRAHAPAPPPALPPVVGEDLEPDEDE